MFMNHDPRAHKNSVQSHSVEKIRVKTNGQTDRLTLPTCFTFPAAVGKNVPLTVMDAVD